MKRERSLRGAPCAARSASSSTPRSPWRCALVALAALSCSNPAALDRSTEVGSIAIEPAASTIVVGRSAPLKAVVQDAAGRPIAGAAVFWSVKDPPIARVSAGGVVTALAIGSTQVAVSFGGRSALAAITVQRPPVASVVVRPSSAAMQVGARTQLAATVYDDGNTALTGRNVAWSSSNTLVATVDAAGLVTAVAPGTATITATSEGKSAGATVVVSLPQVPVAAVVVTPPFTWLRVGSTTQLNATAFDEDDEPITGRTFTWTTRDSTIATVTSTGVVAARRLGIVAITAALDGKWGASTVTVFR